MTKFSFKPDEIGYWSEIKLDIVQQYAVAYSKVFHGEKQAKLNLHHVYIDAFSGAGVHVSKSTGEEILGSALNAIDVLPPFREFFFIDLDKDKSAHLRERVGQRGDVHIFNDDCNQVLLHHVFPQVQYKDWKRGLCLLDPYGLHLNWQVIQAAGQSKSLEIFLNFPIMDMNRNALWRDPTGVDPDDIARMTAFWGDESWKNIAYQPKKQLSLLGPEFGPQTEKVGNDEIAKAFQQRLKDVAGFQFVETPLPMRNTKGAVVYYLFFASPNQTGGKIVKDIFKKYKNRSA